MLQKKPRAKHGGLGTSEYEAWRNMRQRCTNPNVPNYHNYGGRGIIVCGRWADSFSNFLADVGKKPSPSHSLGRIDNASDYKPGNVRWETKRQQDTNRRTNIFITINGITKPFHDWADELPVKRGTAIRRYYVYGWSAVDALTRRTQPWNH